MNFHNTNGGVSRWEMHFASSLSLSLSCAFAVWEIYIRKPQYIFNMQDALRRTAKHWMRMQYFTRLALGHAITNFMTPCCLHVWMSECALYENIATDVIPNTHSDVVQASDERFGRTTLYYITYAQCTFWYIRAGSLRISIFVFMYICISVCIFAAWSAPTEYTIKFKYICI